MSGLRKQKQYDWKDTNIALFGSDTEKSVKKSSAESEPAWKGAGAEVGLQIWRIVKFKVKSWQKDDYGKFYNGDSYIILNTYQEPDNDELNYDLHFWIGSDSSQDEYGTAAYKTVELDTLLDDKPIQHREVMGHESDMFKSYFSNGILTMEGGAETGFNRVLPTEYQTRLLHFKGSRKLVEIREVALNKHNIDDSDVFILDDGLQVYQYNGSTCNKDEKMKAMQFIQQLKSERNGKPSTEVLDAPISQSHFFFKVLKDDALDKEDVTDDSVPCIQRISDVTGSMEMTSVAEGSLPRDKLDSNDVFIVDTTKEVFVWVGKKASIDERRNGMTYAHNYLMKTPHPLLPVSVVPEDRETAAFKAAVA